MDGWGRHHRMEPRLRAALRVYAGRGHEPAVPDVPPTARPATELPERGLADKLATELKNLRAMNDDLQKQRSSIEDQLKIIMQQQRELRDRQTKLEQLLLDMQKLMDKPASRR